MKREEASHGYRGIWGFRVVEGRVRLACGRGLVRVRRGCMGWVKGCMWALDGRTRLRYSSGRLQNEPHT